MVLGPTNYGVQTCPLWHPDPPLVWAIHMGDSVPTVPCPFYMTSFSVPSMTRASVGLWTLGSLKL